MSEQEAKTDPKEEETAEGEDGATQKEEESTATFEPVVRGCRCPMTQTSLSDVESTGAWYENCLEFISPSVFTRCFSLSP